jgi:site-specific DNA-methyltransferase (adenine-specific)
MADAQTTSTVNYNPDVLSCLANLSNDEVFTPPELVNQMLDMLPSDLWGNQEAKFLDPVTKSGVFLREIAKRLNKGLEEQIPDQQTRINHIFKHQLYGIAITELTSLLARRSLYCAKVANSERSVCDVFDDEQGNIRYQRTLHTWKSNKCTYCGASQEVYDREDALENHAYQFIHTDHPQKLFGKDMKFDVIVGNPPYQLNDGGGSNGISAKPIYHTFINQAKKLNPKYLVMIIPARWYAGGKGLNEFRSEMLSDQRIKTLVDFPKSRECFPSVDIAGGICYFLRDHNHLGGCMVISNQGDKSIAKLRTLNEFDIFIRDNFGIDILYKVLSKSEVKFSTKVLTRNSFGFTTAARGKLRPFDGGISLISSSGVSYVSRESVTKNLHLIDHYKISIGTLNPDRGGVNNAKDGKINVTTKVRILAPKEVVTETYIIIDCFSSEAEAINCAGYIKTKFARFLIFLTLSSMHIVRENFQFLPIQDFSQSWTDEKLYKKYGLTEEEISFIESMIRPMGLEA